MNWEQWAEVFKWTGWQGLSGMVAVVALVLTSTVSTLQVRQGRQALALQAGENQRAIESQAAANSKAIEEQTRQAAESQRIERERNRPYVTVTVEPSPASGTLLDLVVENHGRTQARDCQIRIDPPPVRAQEIPGYELAKSALFDRPISLAPHQRRVFFFDSLPERRGKDLPTSYMATVTYTDFHGEEPWEEEFLLTWDAAWTTVDVKNMHHLVKQVETLQMHVGQIVQRMKP